MNRHSIRWGRLLVLLAVIVAPRLVRAEPTVEDERSRHESRLVFNSGGRTAVIRADGSDLEWLELDVPGQVTWQVGEIFPDGQFLLLSMEARRDGPGRPFDEYYTQTPTHLWRFDLRSKSLTELATHDRMAPFYTPALLLSSERMLVQVVKNRVGQIYSMRLDGGDAREFTNAGEGLPYGLSVSPDGTRVAFHLASPAGYQVWTSDLEGKHRVKLAADPAHLYFGTSWSPDSKWIVYHDCHYQNDPGHDWSDLCIGRADGSEHRVLTSGQSQWFAVTYGSPASRGGGSNLPAWTPDGRLVFARRLPESRVPWEYQVHQPDVDHFNRAFMPDRARGGTEIVVIDPRSGQADRLTQSDPPVWDFRATVSPDGRWIAFCRAATGEAPSLWVMNIDGRSAQRIASGLGPSGIDHPRWLKSLP